MGAKYCFPIFVSLLICASGNGQVRETIDKIPFLLRDPVNSFNQKLYEKLSETESGNVVYSPFSLHLVLTQLYVGSPAETVTSKELSKLLGLTSEQNEQYLYNYLRVIDSQKQLSLKEGTKVNIANKLYVAQNFNIKSDFKKAMEIFFASDIENAKFENRQESVGHINQFVKDQTNGLIDKLLNENDVSALTKLVLVNAIYFKGKWNNAFKAENTKQATFHVDGSRQVDYSAMSVTARLSMVNIPEIGADVLELPYENNLITMIIVLPNKDSDIRQVEKKLPHINVIADKVDQTTETDVEVVLPKFDISYDWENLEDNLKSLGLISIFDLNYANLTDIANEPLYVSKVAHKAVIKVNEEGSEAAAATGGVISTRGQVIQKKQKFIADRPFLFYIYDKVEKFPLFSGRLVDPNGKLKL